MQHTCQEKLGSVLMALCQAVLQKQQARGEYLPASARMTLVIGSLHQAESQELWHLDFMN